MKQQQRGAARLSVLMGVPRPGIPGGPQGHLPFLVRGLRAQGVTVVEELYGNPDSRRSLAGRVGFVLDTGGRLRRAMRSGPFDVVHLNTAFDTRALLRDAAVVAMLPRGDRRIVLKFHGSDAGLIGTRNPVLRLLSRVLFRAIDAAGVLSAEERANFLAAGFPASKVVLVKNILSPELYRPDPGFREREGIAPGTAALLFSARLLREKGLLEVIRALPLVQARGHRVVLLCCGDGPVRREAEEEAGRLGVAGSVRMYGQLPEETMRSFYANADLLVFPTYHQEGFPMAVFQSVAAGLPVITTRIRAAADYLAEPANCLWTESRNPGMVAEKVAMLLEQPGLRAAMAEANRRLGACFGEDQVAGEFITLYNSLCDARTRA